MSSNLYHKDVFMPVGVLALENYRLTLRPTEHAKREAVQDRYGKVTIPEEITFSGRDVIEAEFVAGKLAKVVVRLAHDSRRDAVFVALVDGTLKTVWTNLKSDKHKTLKKELYKSAPAV